MPERGRTSRAAPAKKGAAGTRRPAVAAKPAKRGRRSWLWRYRRLLFLVWLLGFGAVAIGVFLLTRVPLPNAQPLAETTFLTDIHGQRLATLEGGVNRVPV